MRATSLMFALFVLVPLGFPRAALAQLPIVTVRRGGPLTITKQPGAVVTAAFTVTNPTSAAVRLRAQVALPGGWQRVDATSADVVVPAGASQLRLVAFKVPANAAAGRHAVVYRLDTGSVPGGAVDSLVVAVAEEWRLELQPIEVPAVARSGDSVQARYLVTNRGNARAQVELSVAPSKGTTARLDATRTTLAPGESRQVTVTMAERAASRVSSHAVQLRAAVVAQSGSAVTRHATIRVLPMSEVALSTPHRLPVRATVTMHGSSAIGGQLAGGGALTEGGSTRLDFLLRPGSGSYGPFRVIDEYRARLRGSGYDVRLGDEVYTLSPLLEPGRYGFGSGVSVEHNGLILAGYAARDRRDPTAAPHAGVSVGYGAGRAAQLTLNYLDRGDTAASRAASARLQLTPWSPTRAELEYGLGAGNSSAYAARLNMSFARFALSARYAHGDSTFAGSAGGSTQSALTVAVNPIGAFTLNGSAFQTEHVASSYAFLTYRGGVGYGRTSAEYVRETSTSPGEDVTSGSARFSTGVRHGPLSARARVQLGSTWAIGDTTRAAFRRLELSSTLAFGPSSYDLTLGQITGRTLYSARTATQTFGSFIAAARLTSGTTVRLNLVATHGDGEQRFNDGRADVSLEQQLPRDHRIAVHAHGAATGEELRIARSIVRVNYTVPLGIPLPTGRRRTTKIEGSLYDGDSRTPLKGVPVYLDDRGVLTDTRGRFVFTGLAPQRYTLRVDAIATGAERIAVDGATREVDVSDGRAAKVDIAVLPAATLTGTVRVVAPNGPRTDGARLLSNVLVSARGESGVVSAATDGFGRFMFAGLPAGAWRVSADTTMLPAHHRVARDAVDVVLTPGARADVAIDVVPVQRTVQLVASGDLQVGSVTSTPAVQRRPELLPTAGTERRAEVAATAATPPRTGLFTPLETSPLARSARTAASAPATGEKRPRPSVTASETFTVTTRFETLENVARIVYGDAALWPKLWVANRRELVDPRIIRLGLELHVPPHAPLTVQEQRERDAYDRRMR